MLPGINILYKTIGFYSLQFFSTGEDLKEQMWSIFFLINDLLLKGSIFCWGTYVFGLNLPSILKKCLINVGNGFHLRAVYLEGNQFWYKPHCPHTCSNTLLKSLMVIRKLKVLWINDGTIKNVRSPSLQKTIYKCVHICFYTDSFIDWRFFCCFIVVRVTI